jgi:WD40 repeat protein
MSVAFSPDGSILASGSSDNTTKLWDVSITQVTELETLTGHTSHVRSVAFSPDGSILASGSYDNTIKLWISIHDTDSDGIPDYFENLYGLNATLFDSDLDIDADGISNLYEYQNGLNIGINDANIDKDGDLVSNYDEFLAGSKANDILSFPLISFSLFHISFGIIILIIILILLGLFFKKIRKKRVKKHFIEQFNAPDYQSAMEASDAGFSSYSEYKEASKIGAKTKEDLLLVQNTIGAPNYPTALKIQKGKFESFEQYNRALTMGAKTLQELHLCEQYQVDSYDIAFKIQKGRFPSAEIYTLATQEGFQSFEPYRIKEMRKEKLLKLMDKAESVGLDQFKALLEFTDDKILMNWLIDLPKDSPLILKGSEVYFSKGSVDDDVTKTIDKLLSSYESDPSFKKKY